MLLRVPIAFENVDKLLYSPKKLFLVELWCMYVLLLSVIYTFSMINTVRTKPAINVIECDFTNIIILIIFIYNNEAYYTYLYITVNYTFSGISYCDFIYQIVRVIFFIVLPITN